jgi:hypothetical protein
VLFQVRCRFYGVPLEAFIHGLFTPTLQPLILVKDNKRGLLFAHSETPLPENTLSIFRMIIRFDLCMMVAISSLLDYCAGFIG